MDSVPTTQVPGACSTARDHGSSDTLAVALFAGAAEVVADVDVEDATDACLTGATLASDDWRVGKDWLPTAVVGWALVWL